MSKLPVRMPSHPASSHRCLIKVVILLWTSQRLPPFLLSDGIRWMSLCYCWGQHCFRIGRRKVGRSIGVVREVLTLLTRGNLQVACVFFRLLPMRFYVRFSQFDTGWASFAKFEGMSSIIFEKAVTRLSPLGADIFHKFHRTQVEYKLGRHEEFL